MKRHYSKKTMSEVFESDFDTIEFGEGLIDWWFMPLEDGCRVLYHDGIPYRYDESIENPVLVDGEVVTDPQAK